MESKGVTEGILIGLPRGWTNPVSGSGEKEPVRAPTKNGSPVPRQAPSEAPSKEFEIRKLEAAKAMADQIRAFMEDTNHSLQFIPNQQTGRVTIKVLDNSGKVVRQIPPEEFDRLPAGSETSPGLLLDERLG
jgi:uncharacterized FlaG/YvyC family protein